MSIEKDLGNAGEPEMSSVELALTQRQYVPGVVSYMITNEQQRHEWAMSLKGFDDASLKKILEDANEGPGHEENALDTLKLMGIDVPEDDVEYQAAKAKITNYYEAQGYQPK